jgi:hypothetical protein
MAWANQMVFSAVQTLPNEALASYIVNPEWTAGTIVHHIGRNTWMLWSTKDSSP